MSFNIKKKNIFLNLMFISTIFFLDRISKIYVVELAQKNIDINIYISKYLNINLIWNKGIAFGLMSFDQTSSYNILTYIIIGITLLVFILSLKSNGLKRYGLLSIFAGSLGNVYDRINFSAVPDFIDFHINEFHWFIFNVADIFITAGVIVMIMTEFIDNHNRDLNEKI
tara:strand:- start:50 stop:556 length:507 start_codon:yes stop_codon:yes gene_type:complete